jgi:hypothetical protein
LHAPHHNNTLTQYHICLCTPTYIHTTGWGVYTSQEVCCAPNVAFPEGCSPPEAAEDNMATIQRGNDTNMSAVPAAAAAVGQGVALTAPAMRAGTAAVSAASRADRP